MKPSQRHDPHRTSIEDLLESTPLNSDPTERDENVFTDFHPSGDTSEVTTTNGEDSNSQGAIQEFSPDLYSSETAPDARNSPNRQLKLTVSPPEA